MTVSELLSFEYQWHLFERLEGRAYQLYKWPYGCVES